MTAVAQAPDRTEQQVGDDGPAVTAEAVRAYLDGELAEVWDHVRGLLARPELAVQNALPLDEHRQRVDDQVSVLVEDGETARGFPERFGGEDDIEAYVTGFQALSFGDLSLLVKIGVHFGLFGGAILHLGNEQHHEKYLPGVIDYSLPGGFAMTETGGGSDVQNLRTTATYDPDTQEFVIRTPDRKAWKDYIGNSATYGRCVVVFAQLHTQGESYGVHAFVVPIRDDDGNLLPGVTIEDDGPKLGLNGVDNGRLAFDGVRVPREDLLDRFGSVAPDGTYSSPIESETKRFFSTIGTLIQGRICIAGAGNSAAKSALTLAVRYGEARTQFEDPDTGEGVHLMDYTVHQRRLLPLLATTYAMHFAQRKLVQELDHVMTTPDEELEDRARRELESRAAGFKALSTWHCTTTIQEAREACGGAGYLSENRLPDLKNDTDVFTTFEGDNTVLLQLVAKGLLTDFRDTMGDLNTLSMARFVAEQVVEQLVERSAARRVLQRLADVVPGTDEEADFLDSDTQVELLAWREEHLISSVARRLRSGIGDGRPAFEVFNECQDHVLLTARAHVERQALEIFAEAVEQCEDEGVKALLVKLRDLHALSLIERDRAWYLEHGRLTTTRTRTLANLINELCAEIRPHARLLVDAFGVPEEALAAALLGDDAVR